MFPGAGTVYKLMYLVGFALMMVINLKTYKRYRLPKKITIIITLITYVAGVVGAMIMATIQSAVIGTYGTGTQSKVAIFGAVVFTPLFMTIVSLILKQDWRRVIDMLAPGIFVILTCAKFGCFCSGCCHGIICEFGIKNPHINEIVFPIQIVEVFFMCFIIAFCFWYALKSKHYVRGAVYPITTVLYCFLRFFVEFLRYYETAEQRNVLFGMTFWQICCILVTIVSIIWLIILNTPKIKHLDALTLERETVEDAVALEKAKLEKAKHEKAKKRREKTRKKNR